MIRIARLGAAGVDVLSILGLGIGVGHTGGAASPSRWRMTIPERDLAQIRADVIAEWLRDGGYDEAIAQVADDDPDLANQYGVSA